MATTVHTRPLEVKQASARKRRIPKDLSVIGWLPVDCTSA